MKYSDNYFYKKLELDVIFDTLKSNVVLPNNITFIDSIEPFNDIDDIKYSLDTVDEARIISTKFGKLPLYITKDLELLVDTCYKGGTISIIELYEIVRLFSSIKATLRLGEDVVKAKFEVPLFLNIINNFTYRDELDDLFRKSVDDNGYILDTASKELKHIRSKISNLDSRIKQKVTDILNKSTNILSDSVIVMRDGRYCLCIKSEYKNSFNGILRNSSASKLTSYMEPLAVSELANEKDELINLEREEQNRIIKDLSNVIALNSDYFLENYSIFVKLDLIFAKAYLSKTYDGYKPLVNTTGIMKLVEARHPLLKVKKVIPNTIEFGKDYKGIVITGPNTGGKTVLLKTIGLLSLMVKFGLLIPASVESDVMIYDNILADIGDDQSIESNLSTFSSHMEKLISIIDKSTPNSLALLDEIGSGTDPQEGSSLAIAVLKYFIKNNINFIVTTHYSELKAFAYEHDKLTNASMAFDDTTNNPTFKLIIGKSGSSNAFKTARRLGLKKEIIDNAISINNKESNEISKLIYVLEKEKDLVVKEKQSLLDKENELNNEINDLNNKLNEFEKNKNRLIKDAKVEAEKIIKDTMLKAEDIISELESLKSSNIKTHEIIDLKHRLNVLDDSIDLNDELQIKKIAHDFIVGDQVYIPNYDQYGILSKQLKKGLWDVNIGNVSLQLKEDSFIFHSNKQVEDVKIVVNKDTDKKVSLRLDLRGKRYKEAKDALDVYISDLLVSGIKFAQIIHGFGTGAIREMVQQYVKKSPYIKEHRYGGESEGGYGVTVITLK